MEYNEILKALREDKDLSQRELSEIFNISQQTLSQYETKRRTLSIEMLKAYAKYFNVSSDYILGLVKDKKALIEESNSNNSHKEVNINQKNSKIRNNNIKIKNKYKKVTQQNKKKKK